MSSDSNTDGTPSPGGDRPNFDEDIRQPTFEAAFRRHLLNSTAVSRNEYEWNGQPSEWKSWPIGRPGPFVSEPVTLNLLRYFKLGHTYYNFSPPDEQHFHIAEFSSDGQG